MYIDANTGFLWRENEMKDEYPFFQNETKDTRTFEEFLEDSLKDGTFIPFDESEYIVADDDMTYPKGEYVLLNGDAIRYEVAVEYMDDEIRERLHDELSPCTEQEFMDAYAEAHYQKFGEEFIIN